MAACMKLPLNSLLQCRASTYGLYGYGQLHFACLGWYFRHIHLLLHRPSRLAIYRADLHFIDKLMHCRVYAFYRDLGRPFGELYWASHHTPHHFMGGPINNTCFMCTVLYTLLTLPVLDMPFSVPLPTLVRNWIYAQPATILWVHMAFFFCGDRYVSCSLYFLYFIRAIRDQGRDYVFKSPRTFINSLGP